MQRTKSTRMFSTKTFCVVQNVVISTCWKERSISWDFSSCLTNWSLSVVSWLISSWKDIGYQLRFCLCSSPSACQSRHQRAQPFWCIRFDIYLSPFGCDAAQLQPLKFNYLTPYWIIVQEGTIHLQYTRILGASEPWILLDFVLRDLLSTKKVRHIVRSPTKFHPEITEKSKIKLT